MEKDVIDAMKKYNLMSQEDQNIKEIEVYEEEEDIQLRLDAAIPYLRGNASI